MHLVPTWMKRGFYWAYERRFVASWFSLTGAAAILGATLLAPRADIELLRAEMRLEQGAAFVVPVRQRSSRLFVLRGDGLRAANSSLRLFENGRELGPAHSAHADIRSLGRGRFSHWGGDVWFSSSDGSDPRTNGRTYTAGAQLSLSPALSVIGWLLALAGAAIFARELVLKMTRRDFDGGLARSVRSRFQPAEDTPWMAFGVIGLGIAAGVVAVIVGWYYAGISTTGLGIARFFPISDAFGYHSCATSLAAHGEFGAPYGATWCSRRALYPAMLGTLLATAGWSSQVALIAQGAMVGAAIGIFSLLVRRMTGAVAAMLVAICLAVYAWEFVLGLFMTEVPGLVLGLCSLCLFLAYCRSLRLPLLFAASMFLSVGLTARAGALFALPLVALWGVLSPRAARQRVFAGGTTLCGLLVGPLMQYAVVASTGTDLANSGGNFSTSLYGLSTGSRDWSEAYRVFDEAFKRGEDVAFQEVYRAAVANIRSEPAVLLGSLSNAAVDYLRGLFEFGVLEVANSILTALAAVGIIVSIKQRTRPEYAIVLILAAGELLAAPLIIDSGGVRVFAVTLPVRVLLAAIGLNVLMRRLVHPAGGDGISPGGERWALPALPATLLGVTTLSMMVIIATPLKQLMYLEEVQAGGECPTGTTIVVARIDRESQSLELAAPGSDATVFPFKIGTDRLSADQRLSAAWFGRSFLSLPPSITLIHAVELAPPRFAAVTPLLIDRNLIAQRGEPIAMCVSESEGPELAGVKYRRVLSVAPYGAR